MVSIDSGVHAAPAGKGFPRLGGFRLSLTVFIAAVATLLVMGAMASRGFSDNGLRLGSEIGWRFGCFVFFAALVCGPLCRLLPFIAVRDMDALNRQMIWGFCACYAVFLVSVLLPNLLGSVSHQGMTAGMTLFALFGGVVTVVMAMATARESVPLLGEPARRAVLILGASFFWLTYALTGLAHLSGPHRPDSFYGLSLSLMLVALLLSFADRFVARLRGGNTAHFA